MGREGRLRLAEIIREESIVPELEATDREGAIRELVKALAAAKAVPKARVAEITESALTRERLGSTGIGKGVAVPHVKVDFVEEPVGALGRAAGGIDFSSLDGAPTHSVFFFLSPAENPSRHIALMSRFMELLKKADFVSFLKQTKGRKGLHEFLAEADEW